MDFSVAAQPLILQLGPIAESFSEAGYRLYLVGGIVRDMVAGQDLVSQDIDLTTDARPGFVKMVLEGNASALWTQGERFGTIGARVGGLSVEITTHRTEDYDPATRKPKVSFGDSLEVDLSRRDFTINAMAISLPDGAFIDPYNGVEHLRRRLLVTPLDAVESFSDDPLRILRAARFLPRFSLVPAPELSAAASQLKGRLAVVSAERISAELDKLFEVAEPSSGFKFFEAVGLSSEIVPALAKLETVSLARSLALAASPGTALVRRAGLLHELNKSAGRKVVLRALVDLRYSVEVRRQTTQLLDWVGEAMALNATAVDVRRFLAETKICVEGVSEGSGCRVRDAEGLLAGLRQLAENIHHVLPDCHYDGSFFGQMAELVPVGGALEYEPPLSGHDIMQALNVAAGPVVGRADAYLCEQWTRRGQISPPMARELLAAWNDE